MRAESCESVSEDADTVDSALLKCLIPNENAVRPWTLHPWVLNEASKANFELAASYVSHLVCLAAWGEWGKRTRSGIAFHDGSPILARLFRRAIATPDGVLSSDLDARMEQARLQKKRQRATSRRRSKYLLYIYKYYNIAK